MGVAIPTLCNYRGLSPVRGLPGLPGGNRNAGRSEAGGLVQPSRGRQPRRAHRHRRRPGVAAHGPRAAAGAGSRFPANWPSSPPDWESAPLPSRRPRRGSASSAGCASRVCSDHDGTGGDQPLRPRRTAGRCDGVRRADRPVPGVRGVRVRLSRGRRRPGHDHGAAAEAAPHRLRQVPDRPAVHRPGPSPGLAARAGDRPRELHPFQDGRVRAVRQGLPGRRHRLRPAGGNRPPGGRRRGADARVRGVRRHAARRVRLRLRAQRAHERAVRAAALGLRARRAGTFCDPATGSRPSGWRSSSASGSRDTGCDNDYCSSVCCMAATKEAILAKEHDAGPGRDRLLPRSARLRQGFRPLLRAGAEPVGRAVSSFVHLADLRDAGDEEPARRLSRVPR